MSNLLPIREWRCQDINQVVLHGDHFFLSSEFLDKNVSIQSKLSTAACWFWEITEENLKQTCVMSKAKAKATSVPQLEVILRTWGRWIWSMSQNLCPLRQIMQPSSYTASNYKTKTLAKTLYLTLKHLKSKGSSFCSFTRFKLQNEFSAAEADETVENLIF